MSEQRALESACLAPEVVASYLDDRLSGPERESVETHVVGCDECRELLVVSFRRSVALAEECGGTEAVAGGGALPRRPGKLWVFGGGGLLAAAAMVLLIIRLDPAWWRELRGIPPGVTPELSKLVTAAGTNRYIEPRLTGGFAWGPVKSVTRSGQPGRRLPPEINIAILGIERAKDKEATEGRHALAIAKVFDGDLDGAVETLEQVAAAAKSPSPALTDLSAAYLARSRERGDDSDAKRALEAAQRAVLADASLPEAWFNLALAREAVGDAERAREAWKRYLTLDQDPKSRWREEAQRHLQP